MFLKGNRPKKVDDVEQAAPPPPPREMRGSAAGWWGDGGGVGKAQSLDLRAMRPQVDPNLIPD